MIEIFGEDYNENDPSTFISKVMDFKLNFKTFAEDVLGFDVQPFHMEWIHMVTTSERVSITAPTGFGKTTILGTSYLLWRCMFEKNKEFLIISKSIPQAVKVLERIRIAIEENEYLKELMPDQKVRTTKWTKTDILVKSGCQIYCKPFTENIKGYHVDFILCDEAASYVDQSIFFRFVVTRAAAKHGTVATISTPESIADLMEVLARNPAWTSKKYKAISDDDELLWPERFDRKRLALIRDEIGQAAFEREYLCNPTAVSENAIFTPELVQDAFDYTMSFGERIKGDSMVILGCDFAIASGPRADFDSYLIVERLGDKAVIRHGERHKGLSLVGKMMRIEQLIEKYKVTKVVIDPSNVGAAIAERLREKMIPFEAPDFSSQSRAKMLLQLRRLFEERRIIIPRNEKNDQTLGYTNILVNELISFTEAKTKVGNITYLSTAPHDDTAISLVLACKPISEAREFLDFVAI